MGTVRVLHVDDEPGFADLAATWLEREDDRLVVETATDAASGCERLAEAAVDCVVSDYDMPGQNGIEFLRSVRADHPELPFVLFTGRGSEAIASEAISAGVTEYMQKESGTDQYAILANRITNGVKRYRARKTAERTRRWLREITESSTDCRWLFTADWEELLFVSGYEDIWGRSPERIRENPTDFLDGIHPDDRAVATETMARLSGGEPADVEYRIRRGDGSVGWVWAKGEPIRNAAGEVVRVVGLTREITGRKRHQRRLEALNRAARRLVTADDAEAVAATGVEVARDVLGVDAAAIHLHGGDADELHAVAATDAVCEFAGEPPALGDDSVAWRAYRNGSTETIRTDRGGTDLFGPETPVRTERHFPVADHGVVIAGSVAGPGDERVSTLGEILADHVATALRQVEQPAPTRGSELPRVVNDD